MAGKAEQEENGHGMETRGGRQAGRDVKGHSEQERVGRSMDKQGKVVMSNGEQGGI